MNLREIKSIILELSSEDAWGSWELWRNISADRPDKELASIQKKFMDVIKNLVDEKKIIALKHILKESFDEVIFDPKKLEYEINNADKPDPYSFYWFETTDTGKKEDIELRS